MRERQLVDILASKVVLQKTDEGAGEFAIYFLLLHVGFMGCTPYFIGPVPFGLPTTKKDIIFVGLTGYSAANSSRESRTTKWSCHQAK